MLRANELSLRMNGGVEVCRLMGEETAKKEKEEARCAAGCRLPAPRRDVAALPLYDSTGFPFLLVPP